MIDGTYSLPVTGVAQLLSTTRIQVGAYLRFSGSLWYVLLYSPWALRCWLVVVIFAWAVGDATTPLIRLMP